MGSAGSARRTASAAHDPPLISGCSCAAATRHRTQVSTALADQLADGPRPHRRQLPPQVLGDRKEERLDHLGRARELGPQVLALRGDAGRTGVEVALARHVAADRDQRRRPEGELLGTEQRRDQQVPPGLEAAVGAQRDAVAEIVPEQHLVDFASPSSHGAPTCLIDDSGDAPVPPA